MTAQSLKLARITEKFHQLLYVFLGFVHARHISESRLNLIFGQQFRLAPTKRHGTTATTAAALHLPHEEHGHCKDNQNRETG